MYSDKKIIESKILNYKLLFNKDLINIDEYLYQPNLNNLLTDYINVNMKIKDISILNIDYKQYNQYEDDISFMINELNEYTPNFIHTFSKDNGYLLRERIESIPIEEWIIDKDEISVSQVFQQIFLSYSLAYDKFGLTAYRPTDIHIIDLIEEKEIIYKDLVGNNFSLYSRYLVKIKGLDMFYNKDIMSETLKDYLFTFNYTDYLNIEEIISNTIKEIFKMSQYYIMYDNNDFYNFYDANVLIRFQFDLTNNEYANRREILKNCVVGINAFDIEIDGMKQVMKNYKQFLKNYIKIY